MLAAFKGPKRPAHLKPLSLLSWGIGIPALLSAMLGIAIVWLAVRMQIDEQWVNRTFEVQNQISSIQSLARAVESRQRGYLLTGRDVYLGPYDDMETALHGAIDTIAGLTADNPQHQKTIARLRSAADEKLRELRATIAEQKAGHPDAARAIVDSDYGLRKMEQIRQLLSQMTNEESRLLAVRQSASSTIGTLLQIVAVTACLLICGIGLLVRLHVRRSFAELKVANDQIAATNQKLVEQMQERERAETQLRQMQKMKAIGDLTGGIAHDFNNMLGVIMASLNLVNKRIRKGDLGIERFLEAANQATERAAILTRRLLAFARRQALAPQAVDANKMIVNMSELLRSTLGENIHIETITAGGLWTTYVDLNQLENAVLNIAINARDAMPLGGRLTIETVNTHLDAAYCARHDDVKPGQFVMIAISDTGAGMPPDVAARVFDPFFTTKPAGTGTGLGLSQVYGFIKQSQGHIKIYSEPGAGTTVKIYLPRAVGDVKEIAGNPATVPQRGAADEVILLVEDDSLMRQLATEALRDLGYTVVSSGNAADALAVLENRADVKLLFTDVVMPETNGKQLAEEAIRRRHALKVLFTTGYTPNAVVHGGVLDPGVRLLSKPFTLDQLATTVRATLDA